MDINVQYGVIKERADIGVMLRRSDCSAEDITTAVERHHYCIENNDGGRVIKNDSTSRVTIVSNPWGDESGDLCVKEYLPRGIFDRLKDLIRPPRPRREWKAARKLAQRGVSTPEPLAIVIAPVTEPNRSHYIITRELPKALTLDEYITQAPDGESLKLTLETLADFLAELHERKVIHGDMKASNLLVVEGEDEPRIYMIDLASMRLRKPRRKDIELMLAQLYASIPLVVGRTQRLRFVIRYLESANRPEAQNEVDRRRVINKVVAMGEERNPVWRR